MVGGCPGKPAPSSVFKFPLFAVGCRVKLSGRGRWSARLYVKHTHKHWLTVRHGMAATLARAWITISRGNVGGAVLLRWATLVNGARISERQRD